MISVLHRETILNTDKHDERKNDKNIGRGLSEVADKQHYRRNI